MQSWDSVKVIDKDLEEFGRTGSVRSAGPYEAPDENGAETLKWIDVQLDGDDEPTAFRVEQVAAL